MEEEDSFSRAKDAKYWRYAIQPLFNIPSFLVGPGIPNPILTSTAVITDFEDKRFDLEAYLKMKAGEAK